MLKSFTALFALVALTTTAFAFSGVESSDAATPLPPDTGIATSTEPDPAAPLPSPSAPTKLSIPSIGLTTTIIPVGLTNDGQMDVPDGSTTNVGWYKDGTLPGEVGSAVLDAHVYAAFSNLRWLKVGQDIFVTDSKGKRLHFVVQSSTLYKLSELTPDMLFNQNDARRLNLITCAGKLTPDRSTYDHRLVVYAVLVD